MLSMVIQTATRVYPYCSTDLDYWGSGSSISIFHHSIAEATKSVNSFGGLMLVQGELIF